MILLLALLFLLSFLIIAACTMLIHRIDGLLKRFERFEREFKDFRDHEELIWKIHNEIFEQYEQIAAQYELLYRQVDLLNETNIGLTEKLETAEKRYSEVYEEFKYCKDRLDKLVKEEEPYDGAEMVQHVDDAG